MSILVTDGKSDIVQCFRLPKTGQTTTIATVGAGSAPSGAMLAGVYYIISNVDVTICEGTIAAATDMPLRANKEIFFYVNAGQNVSVYDAGIGAGLVTLTRMP